MPSNNPRYRRFKLRQDLRRKFARRGDVCGICGKPIDYSLKVGDPSGMWYELDEIVPISRGGSPYDEDNLQSAHARCNRKKSNRLPSEMRPKDMACPVSRAW